MEFFSKLIVIICRSFVWFSIMKDMAYMFDGSDFPIPGKDCVKSGSKLKLINIKPVSIPLGTHSEGGLHSLNYPKQDSETHHPHHLISSVVVIEFVSFYFVLISPVRLLIRLNSSHAWPGSVKRV